ncbi:hypothetical protein CRG98_043574 [Punica granatum]|uniref:DUF7903 domain-containing protein n=1 Tax=Punica granatum TaxID=22663 RepID=A0A2I0HWB5_PUNGR|nr:hypothetical protein CRG98_043574 [Punica granatum]
MNEATSEKPWVRIAKAVMQDLLPSAVLVRTEIEENVQHHDEIKLKFVVRVGKVLFLPRRNPPSKDSVSEASSSQYNINFHTDVLASYVKSVTDNVALKIGVKSEDIKDIYLAKLADKSRSDVTVICKCRVVKEEKRHELYQVELNPVCHMIYDISCLEKDLDLRLMPFTKRTVSSPTHDHRKSIKDLINLAILGPSVKGGLRWWRGELSSAEDRCRVVGVARTISQAYVSPLKGPRHQLV